MGDLGADVLQDDVAVSLARALAAANKSARELKIDVPQCFLTITQIIYEGVCWRINYCPKDIVGRRGGVLVVEVDGAGASVKRVRRGQ